MFSHVILIFHLHDSTSLVFLCLLRSMCDDLMSFATRHIWHHSFTKMCITYQLFPAYSPDIWKRAVALASVCFVQFTMLLTYMRRHCERWLLWLVHFHVFHMKIHITMCFSCILVFGMSGGTFSGIRSLCTLSFALVSGLAMSTCLILLGKIYHCDPAFLPRKYSRSWISLATVWYAKQPIDRLHSCCISNNLFFIVEHNRWNGGWGSGQGIVNMYHRHLSEIIIMI